MRTRSLSLLVGLLGFAACGDSTPEGIVVTFPGSAVGAEAEVLHAQLENFMQLHPEIRVVQRRTPDAADQRHELYVQWLNAGADDSDILQLDVIWAFGGQILDAEGAVVVDSRQAVRALEAMRAAIDEQAIVPRAALTWHEEETRFAFQNGQALFMRNWPYASPLMQDAASTQEVLLGIRPQDLERVAGADADLTGQVEVVEPLGSSFLVHAVLEDGPSFRALLTEDSAPSLGAPLPVRLPPERLHLFDPKTGLRLEEAREAGGHA